MKKTILTALICCVLFSWFSVNSNAQKTSTTKSIESSCNDSKTLYSKLSLVSLPMKYSFDFIVDSTKFIDMPSELYDSFFDHSDYKDNCKIAKLPPHNNTHCVLLRVKDYGSDEYLLYIFTLSQTLEIIDYLPIYYVGDKEIDDEFGVLRRSYMVNEQYLILIEEHFLGSKKMLLKKAEYKIDNSGKFIKVK